MKGIAALIMAAILVGWLLWRNDSALPPGALQQARAAAAPRYRFEGLQLRRTDETGQPTVQLTVAQADYFDDRTARLVNIDAEGLSGNLAPWKLHSALGDVPEGEKRLRLSAPVTGTGRFPDGESANIAAGSVWVDEAERQLISTEPLTLIGSSRQAKAKGFTATFDGKKLKLDQVEMEYAIRR